MTDIKDHLIVNIPEKTYQDSQKTTEKLTEQAKKVGRLEAENEALTERLAKESKEITVRLEKGAPQTIRGLMYYGMEDLELKSTKVEEIKIKNVDEADKFLTKVLESEISQERDALQTKYETLEGKLDKKDREILMLNRESKRLTQTHLDRVDDIELANEREIIKIRKTAKGKVEKQLVGKDVEFAELKNQVELERQEANLRETELLGNLDHFKQANDALEAKITELKATTPSLLGTVGNYINKMLGYKKAQNRLADFSTRNRYGGGIQHAFTMSF